MDFKNADGTPVEAERRRVVRAFDETSWKNRNSGGAGESLENAPNTLRSRTENTEFENR
ncbi:MAG: hypothetical protein GY866_31835 [Proteobacteria bacterium]|nr:hypothetical protein [Pseudomonadota bacterium]